MTYKNIEYLTMESICIKAVDLYLEREEIELTNFIKTYHEFNPKYSRSNMAYFIRNFDNNEKNLLETLFNSNSSHIIWNENLT